MYGYEHNFESTQDSKGSIVMKGHGTHFFECLNPIISVNFTYRRSSDPVFQVPNFKSLKLMADQSFTANLSKPEMVEPLRLEHYF